MIDLAAEYGYTLTAENIYSIVREDEELSDEELSRIAGGLEPLIDIVDICTAVFEFFGFDPSDC